MDTLNPAISSCMLCWPPFIPLDDLWRRVLIGGRASSQNYKSRASIGADVSYASAARCVVGCDEHTESLSDWIWTPFFLKKYG